MAHDPAGRAATNALRIDSGWRLLAQRRGLGLRRQWQGSGKAGATPPKWWGRAARGSEGKRPAPHAGRSRLPLRSGCIRKDLTLFLLCYFSRG